MFVYLATYPGEGLVYLAAYPSLGLVYLAVYPGLGLVYLATISRSRFSLPGNNIQVKV